MLNEPDPSYHGAVWTEAVKPLGPIAYIIKARVTLLRDLGARAQPLQRLPLPAGPGDPAAAHARALPQRPGRGRSTWRPSDVTKVIFPGLQDGESRRRAEIPQGGFGGLVGFELKGGGRPGARFIDACSCSTTSPTSATRAAWRSIRPRPRTRS
jgi:O-acetylhomoserine (thiol)-lyase